MVCGMAAGYRACASGLRKEPRFGGLLNWQHGGDRRGAPRRDFVVGAGLARADNGDIGEMKAGMVRFGRASYRSGHCVLKLWAPMIPKRFWIGVLVLSSTTQKKALERA